MISAFFIDRPIFATVLSVVTALIGAIALVFLPIAQYPRITPPGVSVSISYPGANAQVVADTVAAPIEQQVNGIPGMLYMSSQMGNDGSYSLGVTFDLGTDLNTALVMVQNRVKQALPQLPTEAQNQGITIRKKTADILLIVNFYSEKGVYDDLYLSNFATLFVKDELLRVEGVADITYQGQRDYSIRAWLDPQKLAAYNMTALDVAAAIRSQNLDAPAGQLGQPPAPRGQAFQLPLTMLGRLSAPEEFGGIIVKVGALRPAAPATAAPGTFTPAATGLPSPAATAASLSISSSSNRSNTSSNLTGGGMTGTGTTTGSPSGTGTSSPPGGTTGGSTTPGGATATGGGTTGGGSTAAGGGSTGGAATGGPAAMTDLSINVAGAGGSPPGSGVISSVVLGRGGPQSAPGIVRLRDVAHLELGAQNYNQSCTFDGHPSVGLAVFQLPGTNALEVAERVRAKMQELAERFPQGVDYDIGYDITPYVRESVMDVVWTLFEAVLLVAVVVLAFLQSWRSVLIPLAAVPVALLGTFAVMGALGFSLNNISLFGLVLAIGIVVDDAIVVVENVERWLEHGLTPRAATRKAMDEVTGPIVAVALVLSAVFVPCAFISGITGKFFIQFAVTIAVSTWFSAFNSLTLSPALAALLLKAHAARRDPVTRVLNALLGWFFWLFNKAVGAGTAGYAWAVGRLLRLSGLVLVVYGGLLVLTGWTFQTAPTGFVPQQDQGRLLVSIQLPDGASLERTQAALALVDRIARADEGVAHTVTYAGSSFLMQAASPNLASMFVVLKPFKDRQEHAMRDTAVMARLRAEWARQVEDAQVVVFAAPPVPGVGLASGFKIMVEDRGGLGLPVLQAQTDDLVRKLQGYPGIATAATQFRSTTPQLFLDIDRPKAAALGVALADVNQTLSMYLGSLYVNSFNAWGRHWQVTVQAEGQYRSRPEALSLFQVRNQTGEMVPLGTLVRLREVGGPIAVTRYNLSAAAAITGTLQTGVSTGEGIRRIEAVAQESLPLSMRTEWTELFFLQIQAGNTALIVFALAVVSVFLALAALYESWTLPLAVILVVPLCLLCSVAGVLWTNKSVNLFVQIGLVVLVGLACKNAILIVEFARQLHREGQPRFEATLEAARLRLRPIVMTSLAFIFGVFPLVVASGAGAEMRRSLGTAVFSGMLGVTLFGIFLTPVFFYVLQGLGDLRPIPSLANRWAASAALGGLLGMGTGYLVARLGAAPLGWALAAGAGAGVLGVLAVLGVHRTIRTNPGAGKG